MTKNIVSVTAAVLGAGALVTGCNFEQPNAGCIVQDASFANWYAKYDLKPDQRLSTAGCAGDGRSRARPWASSSSRIRRRRTRRC